MNSLPQSTYDAPGLRGDVDAPEMIVTFLNRHSGQGFCDRCLQESCSLESEAKVALIATTLSLSPEYQRSVSQCGRCKSRDKLVTRAV